MADIPTANVQKHTIGPLGPFYLTVFKVKGDGSGVTLPTKITGTVFGMWLGHIDDTTTTAKAVTIASTGIVTWTTAPASNKYQSLFILHQP